MYSITHIGLVALRKLRTPFLRKEGYGTKDEQRRRVCDPSVARRCVGTGVRATKTRALGLLGSGIGRSAVRGRAGNRKLMGAASGGRYVSNIAHRVRVLHYI